MQIWHISVLNESFHINHRILADFPNLPQMLMALVPVAAPCQTGSRAHVSCSGYWTLFMCVLWAPLLFEERAAFQTTTKTVSAQDLQWAPVASWSSQGVCRKDSSNSVWSFKSFWSMSCWTAWFRYLLIITQFIFFTAAGRESLHFCADSQDMGSTFRSLIFHGSWEQHCPQWELFSRVWLSSFPHGGWHCKGKRMLLGRINISTHICVLTSSPLCSVFLSGAQRELVALCWREHADAQYPCLSRVAWVSPWVPCTLFPAFVQLNNL